MSPNILWVPKLLSTSCYCRTVVKGSITLKSSKFCIFSILLSSLVSGLVGQELPPIQSFTPQDYQGENQNWAIAQGADNHIYIANNHNLLEYDGVRWKSNPSPNASIFRSVMATDSLLFSGQYMEFGFWKKDNFSNLIYTSISEQLEEPMLEDEEFWNIIVLGDWVLFQSLDRIYSYNVRTHLFKILNMKSTKAQLFKIDDTVYFQGQNLDVYKIENGAPILVIEHQNLKDKNVVGIYKNIDAILVILENAQFLTTEKNGAFLKEVEASEELKGLNVYCTEKLKDGSYILGTISNGMYQVTADGKLIRSINQRKGLNNNTILSVFQDNDDNLWLGLDNGIGVVNMNSRFHEYLDNLGRLGLVYTSKLVDGNLYLGTNQGLFVKRQNSEEDFKLIPGTDGQVWNLEFIDDTLFCGHNSGTFVVSGDRATLISTLPGTWGIKVLDESKKFLIQGNYDGVSILKKENGNWIFKNKVDGFDTSSRFFEVLDKTKILVNHEYKGLFRLTLDDSYTKVIKTETHPIMGHGSSMVKFQDEIVYTSLNGAFTMRTDSFAFRPNTILNKLLFEKAGGISSILLPDEMKGRLWCFTKKGLSYIYPDSFNASLAINSFPIPEFFSKSLGVSGFENLRWLKAEEYLIGVSNGFVLLDADMKDEPSYSISITEVAKTGSTADFIKMPLTSGQEIGFVDNSVQFNYSVPQYNKYAEVSYQYRLLGLDNEWGSWSTNASVIFNSLKYGDFQFEVRAKVGNTITANIAKYNFSVKRPWYLSIAALMIYTLGISAIFFMVHKMYKWYYTKKQRTLLELEKKKLKRKKLKTEKELIQVKNDMLQGEIDAKNRELAISTMSIIKKNQFLSAIKEQLNNEEKSSHIKSIIRTIDRNIENEDDWKFFEEAFNNADKDFLHTLQDKHKELTPNDLRLCAYLRLNLTSKEIAPLLNISIKSVEVKRYRLRKKMNLPHEEGLTDYILSL